MLYHLIVPVSVRVGEGKCLHFIDETTGAQKHEITYSSQADLKLLGSFPGPYPVGAVLCHFSDLSSLNLSSLIPDGCPSLMHSRLTH